MKKIFTTAVGFCLAMAANSFAVSMADTTILGKDFAKLTQCADLTQLRDWTKNGKVVNAIVMNDIDCGNAEFKPIGQSESKAFEGIFDGNGKTISGLAITHNEAFPGGNQNKDSYAGLFGIIGKQGVVKNLTVSNSTVTASSQYAGAVVGLNYGIVENVKTDSSVSVVSNNDPSSIGGAGGVAGRNGGYGTMLNCENRASVVGKNMVGGIAGANTGAISSSINYGSVSGKIAGGIVGGSHYRNIEKNVTHVPGRIAACQNLGAVSGSTYAGGIVGENVDGSVNNCRNDGSVAGGTAGGVVGYNYFDNYSKYQSGNYTAVVLNSISTTNSVTGTTVGGVVGEMENDATSGWFHAGHPEYSTVKNCYYDNQTLSKVKKAVGDTSNSTITFVEGMKTSDMVGSAALVLTLNTQHGDLNNNPSNVWLNDPDDYPVLDFSGCYGNFKITFVVNGEVINEATTVGGYIVEYTVADPTVPGATFKGWKDDHGNVLTSKQVQDKFYTRAVTYNAVLNDLIEITFVTSFGKELGKKSFEKGSMVFYYDEENDSEIPADFETESASFKFTGWDKPFATATAPTTYTALYDEIAKAFPVRFYVQGNLVDSQFVAVNTAAVAPADPVVEGYRFDGWSEDFSKITAALDIDAKMVKTYNFCYFNLADDQCETVDEGTEIELPEVPENDSTKCSDWMIGNEVVEGSTIVVTGDISLSPKCELKQFNVAFVVVDSSVSKQVVTYGNAAEDPGVDAGALFDIKGTVYKFNNWIEDFSRVTADLDVNADVTRQVKVCFGENCEYVDEGSEVTVPENSDPEDQNCEGWVNGETVYMPGDAFTAGTDMLFDEVCTVKQFAVTFLVKDSTVNTQVVAYGSAATDPGFAKDSLFVIRDTIFKFNTWNEDFSNVTDALDVTADVTRQVKVCFGENCELVDEDTEITIPENSDPEGLTCEGWLNGETVYMPGETVFANDDMQFEEPCTVNTFDVKFLVKDSVVNTQVVAYNNAAEDPGVAQDSLFVIRDTIYKFNKWNEDFSNVTAALDVTADVTRQVEVCFVTDTTVCDTVDAGSEITIPETPTPVDLDCDAWMNGEVALLAGDKITVEEMTELEARCTVKIFDVKFVAFDTVLVDSQNVAYGAAAVAPDSLVPVFEGYRFNDWDADFTYVESNMVVNAVFDTLVKVSFSVDVGVGKIDTSFYVLKDTTFTGLKSMVDSLSGEFFVCEDITVNGEALTDTVVASEDLAVSATCVLVTHTITYYVDNKLIRTEIVRHSDNAKGAAGPEIAGKRFVKWDKDLHNVVADIKTNGIYKDIEVDTIKVVANGKTIDSIIVAKGDSVEYKLPKIKDTKDSTFNGWKVGDKLLGAGEKIIVKFGDKKIVADFDASTALRAARSIASFSIHSENGQLQVIGAHIGDELTVLDLQGRVIVKKPVQNSVELISVANRGSYLVRVGAQTKRVTVR